MAITRTQKEEILEELEKRFKNKKILVFTGYQRLKVKDINSLRKLLKEKGVDFKIYKKTLLRIILEKLGIKFDVEGLEGQVAVAFGYESESETQVPKSLYQFSKENENLKILAGISDNKILSREEVLTLAKLPSREELITKLIIFLKSPIYGFANVLGGNLRGLVFILAQIKQ